MPKVKGIRFSDDEEKLIQEFLDKNQFFDFSTLAKVSIFEFIKKPSISLTPVTSLKTKEVEDVRTN